MTPEKILELYRMGFKPIPISQDGVMPNVAWTRIYDNGWDETELVSTRFANVATCFGKTHLKDENNRELYLNCLDIDSKEVYDRLSIILDINGKERFLISELRKITYVTKTRKQYGLHVYWLSHAINVPVHRNNCKTGFEFEIKTDKSSGQAALPESRHRDDVDFRYRSIGQNKIVISNSLYGEIVRMLDDCLIKEHITFPYNKTSINRQLHERDIEKILDCFSGLYIKGFRHDICYAISGILYKNGIGLETATKIICELGKHDEELKSRLAVMRHTYSKDVSEVSGRRQLLATLKSSCSDDKQAADTLISIMKILNPSLYEPTKIEHNRVAEELIKEYYLKTMEDTQELFYYDDTIHRYTNYGEVLIRKDLELLSPEIGTRNVNEILQKIKRKTPISRAEFDSNNLINVENGLLNPLTGELISHSPTILMLNGLPIKFDPSAKCPKIMQFLSQVLRPHDVFTFMQFIGYCLIKSSKYEKALILLGKGDNGKSIILKLIAAFLGSENCSHASLKELCGDKFAKAELFGKMANTCADLETYKILDTSAFKQLVSGDDIRAQKKHQDPFYFRNHAKLIFSSNHTPIVAESGYSWFKRIIILPLLSTFIDGKDVNKIDELATAEELSGFLNQVLIALKQLIKAGDFAYVEDIRTVQQLFDDNLKIIKDFISEKCSRGSSLFENCVIIYQAYCDYCKAKGTLPLPDNTVGVYLHEMGILKGRTMIAGIRTYKYNGIKLKNKQS